MLHGGIELGGTKMVAGVADENNQIIDRISIPTEDSDGTLNKLNEYFKDKQSFVV